jgi:acyl-CoA thioesterase
MDLKAQAVELFSKDIYAVNTTGVRIEEAGVNYAKCSLVIDERHYNVNRDVMGGAIFTLADYAFGVAANTGNSPTVSLSSSINFIRATKGPVLYAEAKCVKSGKSITFFEITVTDSDGNVVATVMANGFVKQRKNSMGRFAPAN